MNAQVSLALSSLEEQDIDEIEKGVKIMFFTQGLYNYLSANRLLKICQNLRGMIDEAEKHTQTTHRCDSRSGGRWRICLLWLSKERKVEKLF